MANRRNGAIYIGQTSDLLERVWDHKNDVYPGFTSQYDCKHLVWYELTHDRETAFDRERQLKKWNRRWKIDLIEKTNPHWDDLSLGLTENNLYDSARLFEV